ncbi:hypothetical protein ACS0TY_006198 [Phlomoides rotata]
MTTFGGTTMNSYTALKGPKKNLGGQPQNPQIKGREAVGGDIVHTLFQFSGSATAPTPLVFTSGQSAPYVFLVSSPSLSPSVSLISLMPKAPCTLCFCLHNVGTRHVTGLSVTNAGSSWGLPSIFGSSDNRTAVRDNSTSKPFSEPVQSMEHGVSMIHLREPPSVLRPSETHSEQDAIEIVVTKMLLGSYYDIVRKNIEDSIPKAIMHFLAPI